MDTDRIRNVVRVVDDILMFDVSVWTGEKETHLKTAQEMTKEEVLMALSALCMYQTEYWKLYDQVMRMLEKVGMI